KGGASFEAAAKKRFYPASLITRAKARLLAALQKKDHALVLQAQKDLEFAELFAGNSPLVLLTKLRLHSYTDTISPSSSATRRRPKATCRLYLLGPAFTRVYAGLGGTEPTI